MSEANGLLLTAEGNVLPLGTLNAQYLLRIPQDRAYQYVSGNTEFGAAIDATGNLHYWWGDRRLDQLAASPLDTYREEAGEFQKVDADDQCLLALRADGSLFYFDREANPIGIDLDGPYIDCDIESYTEDGGGIHGAALNVHGEIVTFGFGSRAEEGFYNEPIGSGFTSLAVTPRGSFALHDSGVVWKWGYGESANPISGQYKKIVAREDSDDVSGLRDDNTVDWELDREPQAGCTSCPSEASAVLDIACPDYSAAIVQPSVETFEASEANLDVVAASTKPHDQIILGPGTFQNPSSSISGWSKTFLGSGPESTTIILTNGCYGLTIRNATVHFEWANEPPYGPYDFFNLSACRFENCVISNGLPILVGLYNQNYAEHVNCIFQGWEDSSKLYDGHLRYVNCAPVENLPQLFTQQNSCGYPRRCIILQDCSSDLFGSLDPERSLLTLMAGDVLHLVDTTIRRAQSIYGGAIHIKGRNNCELNNADTGTLIRGGIFEECQSLYGGAIYAKNPIDIVDSTFLNNTAEFGGGVYLSDQSSILNQSSLSGCRFLGNRSGSGGLALQCIEQSTLIQDCFFSHQVAGPLFWGSKSAFLVERSYFCENETQNLNQEILAIDLGGNEFVQDCQDLDCNNNGILDPDELRTGSSADCDQNGILDECDIQSGIATDCDSNGIPDSCDLLNGDLSDCDSNNIPDVCTILETPTADSNQDGILDACQCITDINSDGFTDFTDLLQLLSCWGSNPEGVCNFADVSEDGAIDFADVLIMLNDFGPC